jgi:hypothetical protein
MLPGWFLQPVSQILGKRIMGRKEIGKEGEGNQQQKDKKRENDLPGDA